MADERTHDLFTGARMTSREVEPGAERLGIPEDKLGLASIPLRTADKRQAVILMLFPPEALRDQPLDVVEATIALQAQGILKAVALEIYRSFTSDPIDVAGARNILEAIQAHVDSFRKT